MSVLRWVLNDPYDTNPATNTYTFPRNPESMTSPLGERSLSSLVTTAGKVLLYEGTTPAKSWQFSGPLLEKAHYDALYTWVYTKNRRVNLTDHYGRVLSLAFQTLDAQPKRRVNYYWSHDYTVTALILSMSAATVGNVGPV